MCLFGFFVVLLSLTVKINLPLKLWTDHYFVSGQTYKISRGFLFLLVEWPAQLNPSCWILSHLQESAKNTSLPSLFDPLTLALAILILFLKKTNKLVFLIFFVFYLFVFFLFIIQLTKSKKSSNTSLLYSFSILSVFFSFIIKKQTCYVYCVKLTETCHSTCISLLFCWFWLLPLSSFVSRFGLKHLLDD